MWRAYTSLGFLEYSFVETTQALHPMYVIRALGGGLFLVGALIMAYNLVMTIVASPQSDEAVEPGSVPVLAPAE
jgi:cytochrome c oxidase cbb3-type subunit 1